MTEGKIAMGTVASRFGAMALAAAVTSAVAALVVATAAAAQSTDAGEPTAERRMIDIPEFERLFLGKTVYFELPTGELWGREYYLPGSNDAVFQFAETGQCLEGYWAKVDDRYCFFYRDQPSCWLTYWEGDKIIVVSREGNRQQIRQIVDYEPISCEPAVTS